MTWNELASLDDCFSQDAMREVLDNPKNLIGIHESVLRSFQVLNKVEEYLKLDVPHSVILEMLEHVR